MLDDLKFKKNSVSLPINVVVMMIIGIVIFALGMSLFSKISSSGNQQIDDLNKKVVNDISSLECSGDDWICSPSNVMKMGENKVFQVYIANKADAQKIFKIGFPNLVDLGDGKNGISKTSCGSVIILYPTIETKVLSGNSASFPFKVISTRVKKKCSFVTRVNLIDVNDGNKIIGKSAVIIRVE